MDDTLILLSAAALGTYACRALGVALAGRIDASSLFFQWVSCVTYAMVAALTLRLLVFPQGLLASMPLGLRMLIGGCAMAFVWLRPQSSLLIPLGIGILLTAAYGQWGLVIPA
jgi:branched-subunit amino acid transport protein